MKWYAVTVEDRLTGIIGIHYQYAMYPSTARETEQGLGFIVHDVNAHQ